MYRRALPAKIHRVTKNQTQLNQLSMHVLSCSMHAYRPKQIMTSYSIKIKSVINMQKSPGQGEESRKRFRRTPEKAPAWRSLLGPHPKWPREGSAPSWGLCYFTQAIAEWPIQASESVNPGHLWRHTQAQCKPMSFQVLLLVIPSTSPHAKYII